MRHAEWKNPNKQDIHSGHATWDATVRALMPGNVIDPGYMGVYVRPGATPFYPDGRTPAKPGQMRAFDLEHLGVRVPQEVRSFVETVTETEYAILYCFFHHDGSRLIEHGWLVTRGAGSGDRDDPANYRRLRVFYTGPTSKSRDVVDTATDYLSNP